MLRLFFSLLIRLVICTHAFWIVGAWLIICEIAWTILPQAGGPRTRPASISDRSTWRPTVTEAGSAGILAPSLIALELAATYHSGIDYLFNRTRCI